MLSENNKNHPTLSQFASDLLMQRVQIEEQIFPAATLYIVGLPIGNLADITLRALWVLDTADVIACEDTRQTRKVLDRYGIHTPTVAVHQHNEAEASAGLAALLREGKRVALVTDAGTPAVSDPGAKAVRIIGESGFRVVPVPGPSAVVTAMSASGLDSYTFTFVGFVPPNKKARGEVLQKYADRSDAFILYEAPHRIGELLLDLAERLKPDRRVVIGRELTKRFESFYPMRASEIADWVKTHEARGEYVIAVDEDHQSAAMDETTERWIDAIAEELPASKAAAVAARVSGLKRDDIYQHILNKKSKK